MLKLFGAALLIGASARIGIGVTEKLGQQVLLLRQLTGALQQMERELGFRLTAMPDLMAHLAVSTQSPTKSFFALCAQRLNRLNQMSFAEIWEQAVKECFRDVLHQDAVDVLLGLGSVLGRYDRYSLSQALSVAVEQLETCREKMEGEWHRLGRVYTTLGLAGGATMVLLLI